MHWILNPACLPIPPLRRFSFPPMRNHKT